MARIIYSDDITYNTQNLILKVDANTGFITTTYSVKFDGLAPTVASYSTNTTFSSNNNLILINSSSTYNLPTNPPNGTTLIIRNCFSGTPTLNAGTYSIRNINQSTGTSSILLEVNGAYMITYFNQVWYGI